ncbi:PREDICTED: squalene synthase-like [Populus euphratica]|uniref:Squalene synthase-like n=1 Tax=Populus euphratica TaxID=75702 RepID=A0AAJ6X3E7_POPEU|nr:PREDICTED: squalene synthase-like [Populus euphratica]
MVSLGEILKHPDDLYPLLKLKMAAKHAEKQIPSEPHWAFCYSLLHRVSRSFAPVIQQLGTELRNVVCIFYLVLRALDTVEDDTAESSLHREVRRSSPGGSPTSPSSGIQERRYNRSPHSVPARERRMLPQTPNDDIPGNICAGSGIRGSPLTWRVRCPDASSG